MNNKTVLQIAIEKINLAIVELLISKKELDVNVKCILDYLFNNIFENQISSS